MQYSIQDGVGTFAVITPQQKLQMAVDKWYEMNRGEGWDGVGWEGGHLQDLLCCLYTF